MNSIAKNPISGIDYILWTSVFYVLFEFYLGGWSSLSLAFYFWHGVVIALLAYRIGLWSGQRVEQKKRGQR